MMRMSRIGMLGLMLMMPFLALSQELNCQVQINSQQIAINDNTVFEAMQRSVYEFMNSRRWTNDKYRPSERIDCSLLIQINKRISTDTYEATFQISSSRPIYGSTYSSPLFRYQDESVVFKYLQFDVLDFSSNAYLTELTSILGYYAYVILAMDNDSYSLYGGQEHWQKAQQIVSNAQTSGQGGWLSFSSRNNRYWLVQNYLNDRFKPLRDCVYMYHRQGFDQMSENVQKGRSAVFEALKLTQKVHKAEPNSFNTRLFYTAKNDEIIKLFTKAEASEKNELITLLETVDPANSNKYGGINDGGR
ncbi:MAG: DUF4835 family protein [Flavobacteriales bacterium]|nr:DUF4835 family protein [Flavobacteriales bacterium]